MLLINNVKCVLLAFTKNVQWKRKPKSKMLPTSTAQDTFQVNESASNTIDINSLQCAHILQPWSPVKTLITCERNECLLVFLRKLSQDDTSARQKWKWRCAGHHIQNFTHTHTLLRAFWASMNCRESGERYRDFLLLWVVPCIRWERVRIMCNFLPTNPKWNLPKFKFNQSF